MTEELEALSAAFESPAWLADGVVRRYVDALRAALEAETARADEAVRNANEKVDAIRARCDQHRALFSPSALEAECERLRATITDLERRVLPLGLEMVPLSTLATGEVDAVRCMSGGFHWTAEWSPSVAPDEVKAWLARRSVTILARRKPAPEPQVVKVRAEDVRPGMVLHNVKDPDRDVAEVVRVRTGFVSTIDHSVRVDAWGWSDRAYMTAVPADCLIDVLAPSADEDGAQR